MRTSAVAARTTLLLTRMRFHLHQRTRGGPERAMLAEECVLLAFRGAPEAAQWLDAKEAEALLQAVPAANMGPDLAAEFVRHVTTGASDLGSALEEATKTRAAELLQAHRRVRDATRSGGSVEVKPQPEPDLLGIWVFIPVSA
jgi:hypothetical protein